MKYTPILCLLCLFALLTSCAVNRPEFTDVQKQSAANDTKIKTLEQEIATLKSQTPTTSVVTSDNGTAVNTIDVNTYKQDSERNQTQIQILSNRIDALQGEISILKQNVQVLSNVKPATPEPTKIDKPVVEEHKTAEVKDTKPVKADKPKEVKASVSPAQTSYQNARNLYEKRDYPASVKLFLDLLTKYPTDDLAGASQYWIGECFYSMEDFASARREFQKVVDSYPNSSKVIDAQVKIAYTYTKEGNNTKAKEELDKIIQKYPNYERIDQLKKKVKELQ